MSTTTQTHLMTVEEFENIDDDYYRHELIKGDLLTIIYQGAPDLAVEVLSPGDRKGYVQRKLAIYLETGVRSVWLVEPRRRTVEVIYSLNDRSTLHEDDELIDDTVPGFRVKVSEIFA